MKEINQIADALEHLTLWTLTDRVHRQKFLDLINKLRGAALEQQQSKTKPKRSSSRSSG